MSHGERSNVKERQTPPIPCRRRLRGCPDRRVGSPVAADRCYAACPLPANRRSVAEVALAMPTAPPAIPATAAPMAGSLINLTSKHLGSPWGSPSAKPRIRGGREAQLCASWGDCRFTAAPPMAGIVGHGIGRAGGTRARTTRYTGPRAESAAVHDRCTMLMRELLDALAVPPDRPRLFARRIEDAIGWPHPPAHAGRIASCSRGSRTCATESARPAHLPLHRSPGVA